jgi:hypothetical protein
MHLLIPSLAYDVERGRDAERDRRSTAAAASGARSHVGPRRLAAIALARICLASAAAVRRLDACIADDLVRPMVSIDGI